MSTLVMPEGPIPAKIMIVGEAPGENEEKQGKPFVGKSGEELNRMLSEVGISRSECFVTNVCRIRPPGNEIEAFIALKKKDVTPQHVMLRDKYVLPPVKEGFNMLWREVQQVRPNVIVAFGNLALWALTGNWGITRWRGSQLRVDSSGAFQPKVIPTIHPASVLRQWNQRSWVIRDLQRAAVHRHSLDYNPPKWAFRVRPSYQQVVDTLNFLLAQLELEPLWIEFDIETRFYHLACIGLSWSLVDAITIPLMTTRNKEGYFSADEEAYIIWLSQKVLTHKNAMICGQNLLYDSQYTYRHWYFVPRVKFDTMLAFHTIFAAQPKKLDFQASLFCDHYVYWKDDGKEWNPKMGEEQFWTYNSTDCVRTREVRIVEERLVKHFKLEDQNQFMQDMFWPILQTMQRGVRIDLKAREEMRQELEIEMEKRQEWFKNVLGHTLNPRSTTQMRALFYNDLQQPVMFHRISKQPTLDDDALEKLGKREPLLRPLLKNIQEFRSLGVFKSTFIEAPLDEDLRMRTSYNPCGTVVYRLNSSENAFGSGTNLQNIPKGMQAKEPEDLSLPNIRKIFVPDPGFVFFDMDLDRADLHPVAWEADDKELKRALKLGLDLHCFNAAEIYDIKGIPPEELIETHPNYKDHRGRIGDDKRQKAKVGAHAVDYYCKARTLSQSLGSTVWEAQKFIDKWLALHPGIKSWQEKVHHQLTHHRFVENRYGFRCFFFDRPEDLLPEALAWIPASTVAITINKAWKNIYEKLPEVWVLLQVHDSLAGQIPQHLVSETLPKMKELSRITIPYDDPLIIPTGIKISEKSWGDCGSVEDYFKRNPCEILKTGSQRM